MQEQDNQPQEQKEQQQLSNIIEENSERHNISSVKNSNLINNLKVAKPKCFICGEENIEADEGKPVKQQNVLIYPCLCNQQAHRECVKLYIVDNQLLECPTCKTTYAAGKASSKFLSQVTPDLISTWIVRVTLFFLFILMMVVFIIFANEFQNTNSVVQVWRDILIVLFSIILVMGCVYMICLGRGTIRRLNRADIEVYCNQTEIGYHNPNGREILREYFENVVQPSFHEGGILNSEKQEGDHYSPDGKSVDSSGMTPGRRGDIFGNKGDYEEEEGLSKILNFNENNGYEEYPPEKQPQFYQEKQFYQHQQPPKIKQFNPEYYEEKKSMGGQGGYMPTNKQGHRVSDFDRKQIDDLSPIQHKQKFGGETIHSITGMGGSNNNNVIAGGDIELKINNQQSQQGGKSDKGQNLQDTKVKIEDQVEKTENQFKSQTNNTNNKVNDENYPPADHNSVMLEFSADGPKEIGDIRGAKQQSQNFEQNKSASKLGKNKNESKRNDTLSLSITMQDNYQQ